MYKNGQCQQLFLSRAAYASKIAKLCLQIVCSFNKTNNYKMEMCFYVVTSEKMSMSLPAKVFFPDPLAKRKRIFKYQLFRITVKG